jgi:predicted secreted protein
MEAGNTASCMQEDFMQKIIFAAHCVLNTASKVVMYNTDEMAQEEALRRHFVHAVLDAGLQMRQMPCPEFTLYGCKRWGHCSDQFDNPFFRNHCQKLLAPVLDEVTAYMTDRERFEVLGFVGIDGSPSCGVDYTCTGPWGGNLAGRDDLAAAVAGAKLVKGRGVFFDELNRMLGERGLRLPCMGLFAPEPDKIMALVRNSPAC